MRRRRCNQCWKRRALKFFRGVRGGLVQDCDRCRRQRRTGERPTPRRGLDAAAPLRVHWNPSSQNRKLGPIPVALVSPNTCPPTCGFFGQGCFAEFHLLKHQWTKVAERGVTWGEFCDHVAHLPAGQLWRYAEAGDLPGDGTGLDVRRLELLVAANALAGARGFTFTHKPLFRDAERQAVREANELGFTINLSADGLEQADELAELGVGPIAVVVPSETPRGTRTPAGRHLVLCPSETHGLTCGECQLCAHPARRAIVAFRAHGQMAKTVSRLVQLRRPSDAGPELGQTLAACGTGGFAA